MCTSTPRVVIYSKPDCHLCDITKERVESVRTRVGFHLDIIDITTDDALMNRYGERIPLVEVNGEELFEYRVNPAVLERRLTGGPLSFYQRLRRLLSRLAASVW